MTPLARITDHAVDRLIERHCPGESWGDAYMRLDAMRRRATHVEDIADEDGQELWVDPETGIQMVAKGGWIKTVLPVGARRPGWRDGRR